MEISKRLLIANDDMVGMELLVESLSRKGVEVLIVGSVDDALKAVKNKKFDLIITDIDFKSEQTGLDLITEIRKTDKDTKIIVATGFGNFYKEKAISLGANGYFEKPLYIEEHILKPLGIVFAPSKAKVVSPSKKNSLRVAVHELYNKQGYAILISSLLKESLGEYLKENDDIAAKPREMIRKTIDDLAEVEKAVKESDALLKRIRNTVYKKLNADKELVED